MRKSFRHSEKIRILVSPLRHVGNPVKAFYVIVIAASALSVFRFNAQIFSPPGAEKRWGLWALPDPCSVMCRSTRPVIRSYSGVIVRNISSRIKLIIWVAAQTPSPITDQALSGLQLRDLVL
jgi:hypothetical protein